MNALGLYHDLKERGVNLEASGASLKVDAPADALTDEDRAALREHKPALLEFLFHKVGLEEAPNDTADTPKSKALWAGPGWIRIFDPVEGVWHEIPSASCLPGVLAEAEAHRVRRKGGAA